MGSDHAKRAVAINEKYKGKGKIGHDGTRALETGRQEGWLWQEQIQKVGANTDLQGSNTWS